jgi:hypothetical protein
MRTGVRDRIEGLIRVRRAISRTTRRTGGATHRPNAGPCGACSARSGTPTRCSPAAKAMGWC